MVSDLLVFSKDFMMAATHASACPRQPKETYMKQNNMGIHLLWSLTKDKERLKCQTLELSDVLNELQ